MARLRIALVIIAAFGTLAYDNGAGVDDRAIGSAQKHARGMVTHPLWRDVVARVPLAEALEDRHEAALGLNGERPVASRHVHNAAFPAQVFSNVCLRFESEGSSHVLRGGAPFWHRERGRTTLVIIRGGANSAANNGGGGWPAPSQLPQVFSEQAKARGDIAADNGSWVSVAWDLIPVAAPMNAHAHPARKWARAPGTYPRVAALRAPSWPPYAEYDGSVEFVKTPDPSWGWVGGVTHHYRGFHGGLGDSLHNALYPAAALYAFPGAVNAPVVDNVLFDHGCECFTQESQSLGASAGAVGGEGGGGGGGSGRRQLSKSRMRAAALGLHTLGHGVRRHHQMHHQDAESPSSGGGGGVRGDAWSGYCLHHGRRTGNCNHHHWMFRVAVEALARHKLRLADEFVGARRSGEEGHLEGPAAVEAARGAGASAVAGILAEERARDASRQASQEQVWFEEEQRATIARHAAVDDDFERAQQHHGNGRRRRRLTAMRKPTPPTAKAKAAAAAAPQPLRFLFEPSCACDARYEAPHAPLASDADAATAQLVHDRAAQLGPATSVHAGFRRRLGPAFLPSEVWRGSEGASAGGGGGGSEGAEEAEPTARFHSGQPTGTARPGPYNETVCFDTLVGTGFRSHGGRAGGGDPMTLFGRHHPLSRKLRVQVLYTLRGHAHALFVNRSSAASGALAHRAAGSAKRGKPRKLHKRARDSGEEEEEEEEEGGEEEGDDSRPRLGAVPLFGSPEAAARAAEAAEPLRARASGTKKGRGGLKVLIYTRQDASHGRRLANPDTVKKVLQTWCDAEGLACHIKVLSHWPAGSFREQVRLMADTGLLVTPHGSALENCLFMREGSALVEVTQRLTWVGSAVHGAMAEGLGLQHCAAGTPTGGCGINDETCSVGQRDLAACLATFKFN